MGGPPDSVVLTHPANWSTFKVELLLQAADLADVSSATTCVEPVAAARQYVESHPTVAGSRICVFDLGGGTFDVAVLERTPGGFEVIGTPTGIEHLGGIDFDEALFHRVLDSAGIALADLDPDDPTIDGSLTRLRQDCVDAKEALSTDVVVNVSTRTAGRDIDIRLTRGEFDDLIRPAVRDTLRATDRALRSAQTSPEDLTAFVVVGGSSRIPFITESLISAYRRPIVRTTHPKHDIALGATRGQLARSDVPAAGPRHAAAPSDPLLSNRSTVIGPTVGRPSIERDPSSASEGELPERTPDDGPRPSEDGQPPAEAKKALVGPTFTARNPSDQQRRRRLAAWVAAAVVVVVVAVFTVTAVVRDWWGGSTEIGALSTPDASPSPSSPLLSTSLSSVATESPTPSTGTDVSSSPAASPTPISAAQLSLPRSAIPLPETSMVGTREVSESHDLYVIDSLTGQVGRRLTANGGDGAVLSPDRRSVIYTMWGGTQGSIMVVAADGSGNRNLFGTDIAGCDHYLTPAWNPTQQDELVLPCVTADSKFSMRLIRLDGTILRDFATEGGWATSPTISPDGQTLAYDYNADPALPGGSIRTELINGTAAPINLTGPVTDTQPIWSPDGAEIIFRREQTDDHRFGVLFVMAADGSMQRSLRASLADEREPAWSPDGTEIVFRSNRDQNDPAQYRFLIMDSDGANVRPLSPNDSEQAFPSVIAWGRR